MNMIFRKSLFVTSVVLLIVTSCNPPSFISLRDKIDLGGEWQFAMDTLQTGISGKWYLDTFTDSVQLPGTMDENIRGLPNRNRNETMRLSRELMYAGMAWYRKEIDIPVEWKDRHISLVMERTKPTKVWVDSLQAGSSDDILTSQVYDLSAYLTPGRHAITILVDNGSGSVPDGITGSHAWTEQTQGNWNGIIGKFFLEATDPTRIASVRVTPETETRQIKVSVRIYDALENPGKKDLILKAYSWNTKKSKTLPVRTYPVTLRPGENIIDIAYKIGNKMQLWSEFDPVLYKLIVTLRDSEVLDDTTVDFGMRSFATGGTQFTINGSRTFLRGKHDACVFPLTGHPPMDLEGWLRVFRIAKSYNINFYRGYRRHISPA
jgi:beta-galactosidase/beta-glucuronidase